ncbi:CHAT domain-containing protein [Sphingomonas sp. MMS24-J13]|uniref:CHAT domain-containing protein n=1 Tax=Sphingomonas sp. MMS24-J13 TaxID=3238686 RepID=UPI00384FBECA
MRTMVRPTVTMAAMLLAGGAQAASPTTKPSLVDSFRVGTGGASLCQMQSISNDPAFRTMFDRSWSLACRDAAAPVGHIYALRGAIADVTARLVGLRRNKLDCIPSAEARLADLGAVTVMECEGSGRDVRYRNYAIQRGRTVFAAEGLAGYDSALRLALRSVALDRIVPGDVSVALTEAGDAAAFARVQAGSLDLDQALTEGYRRNNSGNYAEAAEFFDTLLQRRLGSGDPNRHYGEYVANQALQKSDLGLFGEADALFDEARRIPTSDPVELRLRRNLEAINHLNQARLDQATALLDRPVKPIEGNAASAALIPPGVAAAMNSEAPIARSLGIAAANQLTPQERAAILDAQATGLRGSILRRRGDLAGANAAFEQMFVEIAAIRGGNVSSLTRLRSQALAEQSSIAEVRGDRATAEVLLRRATDMLAIEYPGSASVTAGNARLAAFLARTGRTAEALALYRGVVAKLAADGAAMPGIDVMLRPYLALLAAEAPRQPALAADFFLASQTLVRPGLAETQAILTRELSGGTDEAASLFRQSVTLSREVERRRVELGRMAGIANPTPADVAGTEEARKALTQIEGDQAAVQARLAQYPRYRAVSTRGTTLAELQQTLKPDEGYWKLVSAGGETFAFLATPTRASVWQVPLNADALGQAVDRIRNSITMTVDGHQETHPFDADAARNLYLALAGPEEAALPRIRNLIFEPDGAMLRLPANLLITEQRGVDAYLARIADPKGNAFDLTGVAWLGRSADISTSVSARSFEDVRKTAASAAPLPYLGLGRNAPVPAIRQLTVPPAPAGTLDCSWPFDAWNHPIAPSELVTAAKVIGASPGSLILGADFTDTAIRERRDLSRYRIIHFATHGLVAAPRAGCPARPALLTSWGKSGSDGLLSFSEIYDLKLDADIVILSACDTAGSASVAATREAGVTSGGGRALDGLVRAFVGAGSRSVLATHWVAPDDYHATERLITALFEAPAGTPIADALRQAELRLMDQPDTSHPYYWSAFALVGDGSRPLVARN